MFLGVLLTNHLSEKSRNRYFAFICILWALIFGFRGYGVQNDTSGYATFLSGQRYESNWYTDYGTYDNPDETLEIGFIYFVKLLSCVTENPTVLFLIQGIWLFGIIFVFYNRYNKELALWSMCLLFILNPMSISPMMGALRQSFAICLIITGLLLWDNNKSQAKIKWYKDKWKCASIICFVLSALFHKTSFMAVPFLLLLKYIKIKKKTAVFLIILSFVIALLISDAMYYFLDIFFSGISSSNSEMMQIIAERYTDSFDEGKSYFAVFMRNLLVLSAVFFANKDENSLPYKSLIVSAIFLNVFMGTFIINRILLIFLIIGAPCYLSPNIMKYKYIVLLYVFLSMLYLYKTFIIYEEWNISDDSFLPYKFIWE